MKGNDRGKDSDQACIGAGYLRFHVGTGNSGTSERIPLRSAVEMCAEDMELVGSVTKLLYPDLAKKHKTTDQKIERAIRNAIEVSWERGNGDLFEELFGYNNSEEYSRPTNSEYIAAVADHIRLEYELI